MSTPDPRTEAAAKSLPYVNNYYPTNGQMAIDGGHVGVNDVPMDNQTPFVLRSDYDLLTDALTTEAARVRGETWREAEQYANECEAVNTERGSILAWHKMAAHCRMQAKNLPTNQPTWSRRFSTMRQIVTDCA